jgi:hypothetical protein
LRSWLSTLPIIGAACVPPWTSSLLASPSYTAAKA